MTIPALDPSALPLSVQKVVSDAAPVALRSMAAKGVVPGLKPGEILAVIVLLASGEGEVATTARATLDSVPGPLLTGALGTPDVHPAVIDALAERHAEDSAVAEKLLHHPNIHAETVGRLAKIGSEAVCELIATNEERLLAHPFIIERLYLNERCRMSTADRVLELAVRNGLELALPAFAQAKQAIAGELIAEATEEPTFDDVQFNDVANEARGLRLEEGEDTHELDEETGEEKVTKKAKPLHAVWGSLRGPAKIRFLQLATLKEYDAKGKQIGESRYDAKALRMLGIRDANPLVAVSALNTPGINDLEVIRIASMRNISDEVLRDIAISKEWTRHYMVKLNLVANPRTPFAQAAKFITHLRESDLKSLAKSRDVSGAIQTAIKQQLARKSK